MSDDYLDRVLAGATPVWERQRRNLLAQDQPVCQPAEAPCPFTPPEPLGQARHPDRLRHDVEGLAAGWLVWRLIQRLRARRS